ncbi:hypothetical protein KAR91_55675 [Candidatus Pacearchaeota archaeon]|nr:hypothetical protein [Candidatus Pacearchaeota archaeon]
MAGKILEMKEAEYHARPEINASLLADFADSPDKALLPRQEKKCFDLGHQFEDFVFQDVSGDPWFDSKYAVCDLDTQEPEGSFSVVKSGVNLEEYLVENKKKYFTVKGEPNKTRLNAYNWIQEHIKAGDRHLISKFNFEMINKMASNFLDKMQIDLFGDGSYYPVRQLLEHAEFQKMVFWDDKRAMFDVFLVWDGTAFVLDIKTAAERQFYQMFKSKYGPIQCRQYTEGAESLTGQYGIERVHPKLIFLVANKGAESKDLKYSTCLAESHSVQDDDLYWLTEEYQQSVHELREWNEAGRPEKGYKEHTNIRLYPKN